jgi:DNA topoisomerase VI subunit B
MGTQRQSFSRTVFQTPRVSEYFNARELTMLTGQPEMSFAAIIQKELADNALDAAESSGIVPELSFEVQTCGELLSISVGDNGPGISPEIIAKVLDFSTRTSDKAAYRSPTRGAQGNALKTVIGIPHALGGSGPIIIEALGVRHEIRAWLDPANELQIKHDRQRSSRRVGASVSVTVPAQHQNFDPLYWARAISLFNPHALVKIASSEQTPNHACGLQSKSTKLTKHL